MIHFEFEHPIYFVLLLFIICIYICPYVKPKIIFVHLELFTGLNRFLNKEKWLFSLLFILIISALASPITYTQKTANQRKGRDLVLVLDSSGSMIESGYDSKNNEIIKYDIVKNILSDFIDKRYDDNMGIVLFGSFAFALSPLTYDRDALKYILDYANVSIAGENTAIGDGLHQAISVLSKGRAKKKIIVLLSDGFENSSSFSIKQSVLLAQKNGIKIYTIGIGDKKIYDKLLLEKIAKESKGIFFEAKNADQLKEIYFKLDNLEPSPIRSQQYLNKKVYFDILLLIVVFLLFYIVNKKSNS